MVLRRFALYVSRRNRARSSSSNGLPVSNSLSNSNSNLISIDNSNSNTGSIDNSNSNSNSIDNSNSDSNSNNNLSNLNNNDLNNNSNKGQISPCAPIGVLPDDVLLDIFDFYRVATMDGSGATWPWNRLVHVCQRWRYLVFASPLGLDLCLRCTCKTPVRETLDVWPPLPIEIFLGDGYDVDHIIATLKHRDRVRKICILNPKSLQSSQLAPMMQEPFPALRSLRLVTYGTTPALPDMFLGGSAPRLQTLFLSGIRFPGLPRFLLSASDLSDLTLEEIPHARSISPEALVTGLSALTRLRSLIIQFKAPAFHSNRTGRRPPPLIRVILLTLLNLQFRGVSEYLEDLVARIDAPRLHTLHITFFDQSIFDIQQLPHFIGHAGILGSCNRAEVIFDHSNVKIVPRSPELADSHQELTLVILCRDIYRQVRSMAQICNQFSFLSSIVEQLDIEDNNFDRQVVGMANTQWLELFRPFTAVRTLRISRPLHPIIVPALRRLTGERATEVLPVLDSLYLEVYRPTVSHRLTIGPFIAARRYSDHPVAVHFFWKRPDPTTISPYY